jgi:hypothetical protein
MKYIILMATVCLVGCITDIRHRTLEGETAVEASNNRKVYISTNANNAIVFRDSKTNAYTGIDKKHYIEILNSVKKSLSWHETSKEKELETDKELLNINYKGPDYLRPMTFHLNLHFYTSDQGRKTELILTFKDFLTPQKTAYIRLNKDQTIKLIAALNELPERFSKIKQTLDQEKSDADQLK